MTIVGSCTVLDDDFHSEVLISSKGEKVYVNSVNRGVTGDSQMSIVTTNPDLLREREKSANAIDGLEPFIYRFENDTLELFFRDEITYRFEEKLTTIILKYAVVSRDKFDALSTKGRVNHGYHSVPKSPR